MRQSIWALVLGAALGLGVTSSPAQVVGDEPLAGAVPVGSAQYDGPYSVFGAPGNFGVMYGSASYGITRNYSAFASPWGVGYGYGYAPYAYMPGRHGAGLWNPGAGTSGTIPSVGYYRTFPVPFRADVVPPPVGYYAPGFGPPSNYGH